MGASTDSEALHESHRLTPWEILSQFRNPLSQAITLIAGGFSLAANPLLRHKGRSPAPVGGLTGLSA